MAHNKRGEKMTVKAWYIQAIGRSMTIIEVRKRSTLGGAKDEYRWMRKKYPKCEVVIIKRAETVESTAMRQIERKREKREIEIKQAHEGAMPSFHFDS